MTSQPSLEATVLDLFTGSPTAGIPARVVLLRKKRFDLTLVALHPPIGCMGKWDVDQVFHLRGPDHMRTAAHAHVGNVKRPS